MWSEIRVIFVFLLGLVNSESYNNEWATHIQEGFEAAKKVEEDTGCQLQYEIIPRENLFLFLCHQVRRRSTKPNSETHKEIEDHEFVSYAEQQKVKNRRSEQWRLENEEMQEWKLEQTSANGEHCPHEDKMSENNQKCPLLWYLNRGNKLDMNVQPAWDMGSSGKGIVVTIVGWGIEKGHLDLVANYDPEASFDINQNNLAPIPRYDLVEAMAGIVSYGTRNAGIVSATPNNSNCGIGIAYNSQIGGVSMLDGDVTDAVEARSLSLNNQHIQIYVSSLGPDDNGRTVDGPGNLAKRALINGVENGRQGKGSIFVWASGNGGIHHDNCNCDGYTNSIWTLSVTSSTENGFIPRYSEACSSTIAATYSSGYSGEKRVITSDINNGCTLSHTGTDVSASMAAGIIALVLEANPNLGWRDVQHITIRNCHMANLKAMDWSVNGAGRYFSHSFGYGMMDASGMVKMAQSWTNVGIQVSSHHKGANVTLNIPAKSRRSTQIEVTDHGKVNILEHVQVYISIDSSKRGDLSIYLNSPHGTKSQLLTKRPHDNSRSGFQDWPFLTVFNWGENPAGTWKLEVSNDGQYEANLKSWSLTFHGTAEIPDRTHNINNNMDDITILIFICISIAISVTIANAFIDANPIVLKNKFINKRPEEKDTGKAMYLKYPHLQNSIENLKKTNRDLIEQLTEQENLKKTNEDLLEQLTEQLEAYLITCEASFPKLKDEVEHLYNFKTLVTNSNDPQSVLEGDMIVQSKPPTMIRYRYCPPKEYDAFSESVERQEGLCISTPIIQVENFPRFWSLSCKKLKLRHNVYEWEKYRKTKLRCYENLQDLNTYMVLEAEMSKDYIIVCGSPNEYEKGERIQKDSASNPTRSQQRNDSGNSSSSSTSSHDEGYIGKDENQKQKTCSILHLTKHEDICDIRLYFTRDIHDNPCPEAHHITVYAVLEKDLKVQEFLEKELPECEREQAAVRLRVAIFKDQIYIPIVGESPKTNPQILWDENNHFCPFSYNLLNQKKGFVIIQKTLPPLRLFCDRRKYFMMKIKLSSIGKPPLDHIYSLGAEIVPKSCTKYNQEKALPTYNAPSPFSTPSAHIPEVTVRNSMVKASMTPLVASNLPFPPTEITSQSDKNSSPCSSIGTSEPLRKLEKGPLKRRRCKSDIEHGSGGLKCPHCHDTLSRQQTLRSHIQKFHPQHIPSSLAVKCKKDYGNGKKLSPSLTLQSINSNCNQQTELQSNFSQLQGLPSYHDAHGGQQTNLDMNMEMDIPDQVIEDMKRILPPVSDMSAIMFPMPGTYHLPSQSNNDTVYPQNQDYLVVDPFSTNQMNF